MTALPTSRVAPVWIVLEYGYEYSRPLKVWPTRKLAEAHRRHLAAQPVSPKLPADFLGYEVRRCPMHKEISGE